MTDFKKNSDEQESNEEESDDSDEEIDIKTEKNKTVSVNRKAFVNWVNKDFYK